MKQINISWSTPVGISLHSLNKKYLHKLSRLMRWFILFSVTRLGDFLHFGQLFKAFGNNNFAQISYILSQI